MTSLSLQSSFPEPSRHSSQHLQIVKKTVRSEYIGRYFGGVSYKFRANSIFFTFYLLVYVVDKLESYVHAGGSIYCSVKNELFWKDRTNYKLPSFHIGLLMQTSQVF